MKSVDNYILANSYLNMDSGHNEEYEEDTYTSVVLKNLLE